MADSVGDSVGDSVTCPACGAVNPPGSQYCDQCSATLSRLIKPPDAANADQPAPTPPQPSSVSRPVASAPVVPPPVSAQAPAPPAPAPATPVVPTPPPTAAGAPPAARSASAPARRGNSTALLVGGTLLVLGLFLGVGLTVALLGGLIQQGPTPTPAPAPTVANGATATVAGAATAPVPPGATEPPVPTPVPPATATAGNGATAAADQLLANKKYDQALAAYEAVLAQDAQNGAALLGRGQALLGLGRYQDAVAALTEALAVRGPDDQPTLLARAQAYKALRSNTEALNDADHVLKQTPNSVPALLVRAWARDYHGDRPGAEEDYTAAIAAAPQDPSVYRARAAFYINQNGKKAAALADLQKAVTIAPKDSAAWVDLGNAYASYDETLPPQYPQALDALTQALKIDPRLTAAYYNRARVYWNGQGDQDHALPDINQAIAIGPATADMYYLRAQIEDDIGDAKAQRADLDRAVAAAPQDPRPYLWRAEAEANRLAFDAAAVDLSQAIDLDPSADSYRSRSELYLLLGDFAKAEADARQAIQEDSESAADQAQLANVFLQQSQYAPALEAANSAIALPDQSSRADILALRAIIYVQMKNFAAAAQDLAAATTANNGSGLVYYGQALLDVAQHDDAGATTQLEQWLGSNNAQHYGGGYVLGAQIELRRGLPTQARQALDAADKLALYPLEKQAAAALRKQLKP